MNSNIPIFPFFTAVFLLIVLIFKINKYVKNTVNTNKAIEPPIIKKPKTLPLPKTQESKCELQEEVSPKDGKLMDIDSKKVAAIKVIPFIANQGKILGELVIRDTSPTKRLVLLWYKNRHLSVKMKTAEFANFDEAVNKSLEEAKEVALRKFGRKKDFAKRSKTTELPTESKPAEQTEAAKPEVKLVETPKVEVPLKPITKREYLFKVKGQLMKAEIMEHVFTKEDGSAGEYSTYTATINQDGEEVSVKGNDIKRALADAKATVGDSVTLIHIRNDQLTGGRTRKVYSCTVH